MNVIRDAENIEDSDTLISSYVGDLQSRLIWFS